MKIIFLDIDGVLATPATYAAWRKAGALPSFEGDVSLIDSAKVQLLNSLLESTPDLEYILSSTWRFPSACPHGAHFVLKAAGLKIPYFAETPDMPGEHRYKEILSSMESFEISPEDMVILDDQPGAGYTMEDRFVRTSAVTGLSETDVAKIKQLLAT